MLQSQQAPDIDEGAIRTNAAVAQAVRSSSELVGDQFEPVSLRALLAEVSTAQSSIAVLPDCERSYLRVAFPADAEAILEAARTYLDQLNVPADVNGLSRTGRTMAALREQLSGREEGRGLPAAVLAMIAFAVEFGTVSRIPNDKQQRRALLDDYRVWTGAMRTQQSGTIPFRRMAASRSHDDGLLAFAETHYGRRLGIRDFAIGESQSGRRFADPCIIVAKDKLSFTFDNRSGSRLPPNPRNIYSQHTPNVFVGFSSIKIWDDERFGARLIKFDPGSGGNYSLSNHFLFAQSIDGEYCYVVRSNSELTIPQILAHAEANPSYKDDMRIRAQIVSGVKNANACRIEIALSGRALAMLSQFDSLCERYERSL
jgi:hypothetical protein